ncbi:MAG: hypothetical protein LEGION0398_MBIBDBAK_00966 [Legionellaceae bacterium]
MKEIIESNDYKEFIQKTELLKTTLTTYKKEIENKKSDTNENISKLANIYSTKIQELIGTFSKNFNIMKENVSEITSNIKKLKEIQEKLSKPANEDDSTINNKKNNDDNDHSRKDNEPEDKNKKHNVNTDNQKKENPNKNEENKSEKNQNSQSYSQNLHIFTEKPRKTTLINEGKNNKQSPSPSKKITSMTSKSKTKPANSDEKVESSSKTSEESFSTNPNEKPTVTKNM